MSKLLIDEVQKHRKEIKYETITYGLSELVNMHMRNEIYIQPEYQRLFRWTREQQSLFVESLILEIPIPPLFFYERPDGRWELLDGLQRISTIIRLLGLDEDVPPEARGPDNNDVDWHIEHENDVQAPLQFTLTEYLSGIDGLSFARLPTQLQLNLKRSRMQLYVLKRETDPSYKYEVFKRLNTAGAKLEDQEIRNAGARMLSDEFPNFLQRIAKTADFVEALQISEAETREGRVDELALRFLTMKNYAAHFKHDVSAFLTLYMENVSGNRVAFDFDAERLLFERTWRLLAPVSQQGKIFRSGKGGVISPTLFEVISLAVAHNIDVAERKSEVELKAGLDALLERARSDSLTGAGSNSKRKTHGRIELAKRAFQ